jgi:hypothetical protein
MLHAGTPLPLLLLRQPPTKAGKYPCLFQGQHGDVLKSIHKASSSQEFYVPNFETVTEIPTGFAHFSAIATNLLMHDNHQGTFCVQLV